MNVVFLRQRMKERGFGNDDLATASGVPLGTLNKILNGISTSPQLSTHVRIVSGAPEPHGCSIRAAFPLSKYAVWQLSGNAENKIASTTFSGGEI